MEKKCTRLLLKGFFFIFCLFFYSNYAFASGPEQSSESENFAQLSSLVNQIPGIATKTVVFENVDEINGLVIDSSHEKIIVKKAGLYFIMANGRMGTTAITLRGSANLSLQLNGVEIPNTRCSFCSQNKITAGNTISQRTLFLKKDDQISVGISSNSPNLGLMASQNVPSITFTMYKIN